MHARRTLSVGLALATIIFIGNWTTVDAQGLRGRIRDRIEERQQENQEAQQSPAQQPTQGAPAGGMMPTGGPGQFSAVPDVSVVTLQTLPGQGGQMVVTPKGMVVPLPGPGVDGSSVQIYIGAQGGYWYVDRDNQQVDLTPAVEAYQRMMASGQLGAGPNYQAPPQYAPPPQYAEQPQQYSSSPPQQSSGNGGGGSSAVAAGVGAMAGSMLGSMAGTAMANPYGSVPYGTPMHYGANGMYYNNGNKPVYVNNSTKNFNQVNANQVNNQHINSLQQQQNWYHNQQTQQSNQFKNWQNQAKANPSGSNPFVRSESQAGASQRGRRMGGSEGGGRLAGSGAAGAAGARRRR
jgi:hypothetical protein